MANVSDDMKAKAFKLCRDYLGGKWADLSYEDFDISPVT